MITAMLLAHIMGDFVLQTNRLARWKSSTQWGVLVHGLIVLLVTLIFALAEDPSWWAWALFIGFTHILIDSANRALVQRFRRYDHGLAALVRFSMDQGLHLGVIFLALILSGRLLLDQAWPMVITDFQNHRTMTLLGGYFFVMMPAWVLVKFLVYGLVNGSPPDFTGGTNKYVGILERVLITTCVLLGQFILVPLVALPRLLLENHTRRDHQQINLYVAELLASVLLAVGTGLVLQFILNNG
jgi:hypothetical protein